MTVIPAGITDEEFEAIGSIESYIESMCEHIERKEGREPIYLNLLLSQTHEIKELLRKVEG